MTAIAIEGAASTQVVWRGRLSILALVTMESLALFVLGSLLAGTANGMGPAFLTLLVAALAGLGLTRLLRRFEFPRRVLVSTGVCISAMADTGETSSIRKCPSICAAASTSIALSDDTLCFR